MGQTTDNRLEKTIALCKQFGCRNRAAAISKIEKYGRINNLPSISQVSKFVCKMPQNNISPWNEFKKWLKLELSKTSKL
jgi:hypothetical protein